MTRPRNLTEDECRALIDETRNLAVMLERDLLQARRHSLEFAGDGYPSGAPDGPSGRGGISDPTGNAAMTLNRADDTEGQETPDRWVTDPTQFWHPKLRSHVANARTAIADLSRTVNAIEARAGDPDKTDTNVRRPALGAGHCRACDRDHSGVGDDRLRGGLCDADRKRYDRQPHLWNYDRNAFINEQRHINGLTPTPKAGA